MDIHELSSAERIVFSQLIDVFESFTPDQRIVIGATTRWSAKDVLAHLVAWELAAIDELATIRLGTWQPRRIFSEQVVIINDAQVSAGSTRTFESLIYEFQKSRDQLREAYSTMPADSNDSEPLRRVVHSHCIRHCGRHLTQLTAWQSTLN